MLAWALAGTAGDVGDGPCRWVPDGHLPVADTGLPGRRFVGDVAIKDGKVAAVGPSLDIQGAEEIDATGKHVMPGWTDVHCHFDAQVFWDPLLAPSAQAGVTSASAQFLCACWPVPALIAPCARSRHHGQLWRG